MREEESHGKGAKAQNFMSDEPLERFERQIASVRVVGSPAELRGAVLREVERELRAARWDRRLVRAAAVLLVVGVGMNASLALRSENLGASRFVRAERVESRPSLVEAAIVVAEATDASTARRFAHQLAAMRGWTLTDDEAAAIEVAVRRPALRGVLGNKG